MIAHTVKNKQQHMTFHFETQEHFEKAVSREGVMNYLHLAETVYDHLTRRFVKSRRGNLEMMNAHLIARRTVLNEKDAKLVNEYA